MTDLSSGSVRVLLASGESGDDAVVKSRPGNENGSELPVAGMPLSSFWYFLYVRFPIVVAPCGLRGCKNLSLIHI